MPTGSCAPQYGQAKVVRDLIAAAARSAIPTNHGKTFLRRTVASIVPRIIKKIRAQSLVALCFIVLKTSHPANFVMARSGTYDYDRKQTRHTSSYHNISANILTAGSGHEVSTRHLPADPGPPRLAAGHLQRHHPDVALWLLRRGAGFLITVTPVRRQRAGVFFLMKSTIGRNCSSNSSMGGWPPTMSST